MNIEVEQYQQQVTLWPQTGQHILAQYSEQAIIVYQAYKPSIATYAVAHQHFGGKEFRFSRMSWIKTNFLWMMYRSGWGTKVNQEVTLAITLDRVFFEGILEQAVASSFSASNCDSLDAWKMALEHSDVRCQWDPDHHPNGEKAQRRALQLGLRNTALRTGFQEHILHIEDISAFVREQRATVMAKKWEKLLVPKERIFLPHSRKAQDNIGV